MGRKSKHKSKPANQATKAHPTKLNDLKPQINGTNITKPLLIHDRLDLPGYQSNDTNDDTDLQLNFRARPYFVNSLCCLCSKTSADLKYPCEDCHMVVYCSNQHRQQHLNSHKQLCLVLSEICRKKDGLALAKDLNADEYRGFRVELLMVVERTLGRPMELWEREILLYPRLCRACHSTKELTCCPNCGMEFYCSDEDHRIGHVDYCKEFRVFKAILRMEREHGFMAPRIPDMLVNEGRKLPADFDALIKEVFETSGCDYGKMDCSSYAALSQAASPALTAFYALQSVNPLNGMNKKSLKIHVIGAELQFEVANLAVWEKLFMHLLPGLRSLRLEFCGPELQVPADIAEILENPRLCAGCRAKNCKINVVFHCSKLYHQIKTDRPDLVCLFNPGLYRTTGFANQDTWPATISKFCDLDVPILITSYTEVELPRDLSRVRQLRSIKVELEPRRNPFASLRPERNFVSDDVAPLIYKNYFLSVVRGIPGTVL